ncbi:uncharacterized protein LOC130667824 [Microplitis mediator]|uniref:uncharacterized protein LOC130667824 n=1 Tax=Microplitis mediator TaxID=375433 RepID=UPI002556371B|nr:uncharacterized protein LOC130667824 [Microplitis mediator]
MPPAANQNDANAININNSTSADNNVNNDPIIPLDLSAKVDNSEPGEKQPPPVVTISDTNPSNTSTLEKQAEETVELDDEIMQIIGKDPEVKKEELSLSSHTSSRWNVWLKSGQSKETKEALLKKHPRTGVCRLEAPILNPEIASSLNEAALRRDKYLSTTQNLAGSALSAIGKVIDPLLNSKQELNRKKMLEDLWEASQLLTELHRGQTVARRSCIIPSLNKQVAELLEKTEADSLLFGDKLNEKIKEAKSMEKIGQEIKSQASTKKSPLSLNSKSSTASRVATQSSYKPKYQQKSHYRPTQRANQTKASRHQGNQQSFKSHKGK